MRDEANEYLLDFGTNMHSGRIEQSNGWLDEQKKYFGMEADAYIAGLEREKTYTEQYYRAGVIDAVAYHEAITDIKHKQWDEAEAAYDDMLQKRQDYISDMKEEFSAQEQALRDSWDVEDRAVDMADVQRQLNIYEGAVTDRGQQKYKELQEQMKQLQRDEELYQLQVRNNDVIEQLQSDYEAAEAAKADFMSNIVRADVDISEAVANLTGKLEKKGGVTDLLGQLLTAFQNFKINAPSTTYEDNRTLNVKGMSFMEILSKFMGGIISA